MLDRFMHLTDAMTAAGVAPAPARDAPPRPGDLRLVRPELARWRDGFFYSPPLVLLLERVRGVERAAGVFDGLRVAQTYPDTVLAGPGDLVLTDAQTGVGPLFVETWHIYTLKADQLAPCSGRVPATVVAAVLNMSDDPEKLPHWATLTPPMMDDDPRRYFRALERDVERVFAIPSTDPEAVAPDVSVLRAFDVCWPGHLSKMDEIFAMAEFPDDAYLRAAADSGRDWIWANLVVFERGRITRFRPVQIDIVMKTPIPGGLSIVGQAADLPPEIGPCRVACFLKTETGDLVPAETPVWDEEKRRLFAVFETGARTDGRIAVAIVCGE